MAVDVKYPSIGIIVQWFGPLPADFEIWKRSAAYNHTIDFIFVTDQEITGLEANMKLVKATLQGEVKRYSELLGVDINFPTAYKACDARAFYGVLYESLLAGYDFWGYCDIDLVFGDIRKYLTDEILDVNDRFYEFGHLNIYRNNDEVNHWYKLPGSIYTFEEVFSNPAKTTFEEYYGINRICEKNGLRWYRDVDYADIKPRYENAMIVSHGVPNYEQQVYYWEDGHAYRAFVSGKNVCVEEFVYIHHQKRRLKMPFVPSFEEPGYYLLPQAYAVKDYYGTPSLRELCNYATSMGRIEGMRSDLKYNVSKIRQFCTSTHKEKVIWARQLSYRMISKLWER